MARTIVVREYLDKDRYLREKDMQRMMVHGWDLDGQPQLIKGDYRGRRGCVLFVIFPPLALMAGREPDYWRVTYTKSGRDQTPPRVFNPFRPRD